MGLLQIRDMPTSVGKELMRDIVAGGASGLHESILRSYHVVRKVRYLLEHNTDPAIVLELIELMTGESSEPIARPRAVPVPPAPDGNAQYRGPAELREKKGGE